MTTSTIPVWHSETSQSHNRGRNVCIELGVNIFGVMLAYWYVFDRTHIYHKLNVSDRVDYGLRNSTSGLQWRFPLVSAFGRSDESDRLILDQSLQVLFAVITIILVAFLPGM
jgi:hypothetical protein